MLPPSTSLPLPLGDGATAPARPVQDWNPPLCGHSDMVIQRNGTWLHQGGPITRPALVALFASLLRQDPDGYVLVTPVEKLTIDVEDLPFCAVELQVAGAGEAQVLRLRTNLDEWVTIDATHPLSFDPTGDETLKPRVRVRDDLWARVTRSVFYELMALVCEHKGQMGLWSSGVFYPLLERVRG